MKVLRDAGLTLNLKKCDLFTHSIKYLGQTSRLGCILVDEVRLKYLKEAKHPKPQMELRFFLRLCTLYRRFAPTFEQIFIQINSLLTKGQPVKLESVGNAKKLPFTAWVNDATSPPISALFNLGLPYVVETDASASQVGFALVQFLEDVEWLHIGY